MTGQRDELVRRLDPAEVGKELAATALVMLALTIGLVGFKMEDVSGGTILITRFGAVASVIVLALLGRFALILLRNGRPGLVVAGATPLGIVFLVAMIGQILLEPGNWLAMLLPFSETVVNWLVVIVTFVFAGRGAWAYRHATSTLTAAEREAAADRFGAKVQKMARTLGPALLIVALLFPLLTIWIDPKVMRHPLDIAVLVFTYIMLGWGLNIVVGLAGLLDLGYVAFYAVGAYSYALLAQYFGLGFWVCLPFAGLMAATAGLVLGFPVLRLRGDYLAIVTLGFGEMIRIILLNWYDFTNGPDGLSGIPRPTFFGLPLTRTAPDGGETFHTFFEIAYSPVDKIIYLYYVIIGLALITNAFTLRIRRLPVGRAWEALREDETACRALGINPRNTKLTAFSIGAMFGGFGGSFFAARQTFISPESFTFIESALILAIVVLGGFGSQIGVVFAAILLIGLPEFFRELQQYRMLAFGAAMVLIMVWRPAGLLAHREPTIRLSAQPAAEETRS